MEKQSMTKFASVYGFFLGLVLILFDVAFWLSGHKISPFQNLNLILIVAGIIIGIKKYRDGENKGCLTYGDVLKTGILIAFFASILLAFYTFILLKFLDPGLIGQILENIEDRLSEKGLTDEQVTATVTMYKSVLTPFIMTIGTIFSITFYGFIFSLIIAIFMKKEPNPFEEQPTDSEFKSNE